MSYSSAKITFLKTNSNSKLKKKKTFLLFCVTFYIILCVMHIDKKNYRITILFCKSYIFSSVVAYNKDL